MQCEDASDKAALRAGKHTRRCQCDGSFSASRRCRRGLPIANINSGGCRQDKPRVACRMEEVTVDSSQRVLPGLAAFKAGHEGVEGAVRLRWWWWWWARRLIAGGFGP